MNSNAASGTVVARVKTWEHGTKKKRGGQPGRLRESQGEKCSAPGRGGPVHSVAPNKLSSGVKLRLREAPSAKGPNLAQERESAEGSTKQVLMGESRKQWLVLRAGQPPQTAGGGLRGKSCPSSSPQRHRKGRGNAVSYKRLDFRRCLLIRVPDLIEELWFYVSNGPPAKVGSR